MNELNIPLLRKAMEHIEAHPEEFLMRGWAVDVPAYAKAMRARSWDDAKIRETLQLEDLSCGTTMCLAGTVAYLEGWEMEYDRGTATQCRKNGGELQFIDDVARDALGIPHAHVESLFYATEIDTPAEMRERIETVLDIKL